MAEVRRLREEFSEVLVDILQRGEEAAPSPPSTPA